MKGLWLGCVVVVIPIVQSVSADAADFGQPPAPPLTSPVPYYYSWTGFYIGGNIGGGWPGGNVTDSLTGTTLSTTGEGAFIGGGQIGYNWQISPYIVLGAEWLMDGVASGNNSNIVFIPAIGDAFQTSLRSDWFTTLTGRVGFTVPDWAGLLYVKGGAAWLQNQITVTDLSNGLSVGETKIDTGWVAGAGIEYAFAPNWTIRVEYDYMGFGNSTVGSMTVDPYNNNYGKQKPPVTPPVTPPVIPPVVPPTPTFVSETFNATNVSNQVVMLGINYKFGAPPPPPPPLVTKY
jgi:outer membrane immunogenic protein